MYLVTYHLYDGSYLVDSTPFDETYRTIFKTETKLVETKEQAQKLVKEFERKYDGEYAEYKKIEFEKVDN